MFSLSNVSKSYHAESLFESLSFQMQKKMHLGCVGRNGTGKTTIFRLLMQKETPDKGDIAIAKGYSFGWLEQHIHFTEKTVLEEAIKGSHLPGERLYEAEKILCGLGFSKEGLKEHPSTFSGGFHLRLNLAKVLIKDPDCLLLDEPTNYLDIISIRWLERFLQRWPKEFIVISHDRSFLNKVCTHMMGLHRKKIHFIKGSVNDLYEKIYAEEKIYEKTRVKIEKKKEHLTSFIERFGAKASKAKQAQSKMKAIGKLDSLDRLSDLEDLFFRFQEAPFSGRLLLQADELSFAYDNPLISHFSLEVEKGDKIAIIGKNARGKSTLLRLLIKDLIPDSGRVEHKKNLAFGYFGQTHIDLLNSEHTIEQEIANENPDLSITEIRGICGLMLFSQDLATKKIKMLSGGERSRVLLGKIIATPCNLLLLDEPTHHLDMESIAALVQAIETSTQSLIMVTHDEGILNKISFNKIIYCQDQKQKIFLGGYEEFLKKVGFEEEGPVQTKKLPKIDHRERSKLKKKIDRLEKEIENQEAKVHDIEKMLSVAAATQDLLQLDHLSKEYDEEKNSLEIKYQELEKLYIEYD